VTARAVNVFSFCIAIPEMSLDLLLEFFGDLLLLDMPQADYKPKKRSAGDTS